MLQKLNESIKGIIAWVIVILIAVTFLLFGADYYQQSHQVNKTVVEVNGDAISMQSLEKNYKRQYQKSVTSQNLSALELKRQVLKNMISNSLGTKAAITNGFNITPAEVNEAILKIPQFNRDGYFSKDVYRQVLNDNLFTQGAFQEEVKQQMLLNQQRFAFIGTEIALPFEVENFVKLAMQTRDYAYLRIPFSLFMKVARVTEKQIEDYYQNHQQEFVVPEMVSIDFVKLSMKQIKNNLKLNPAEITNYYNENKNNFLIPAEWQVAHILFAIPKDASASMSAGIKAKADKNYQILKKHPERFTELVKTVSDDKLSVINAGRLPILTAAQTSFDKTLLLALTKPGQISLPVKGPHGYEILKLIAYKKAALKSLPEVFDVIEAQLLAEKAEKSYTQLLEKLGDLSYFSPENLSPVARALNLNIEQSNPFSRQTGNSIVTKNKQVMKAAFSLEVLELGNNSEPIQLDNNTVIVLRVHEHLPASVRPLSVVKQTIREKLVRLAAENEANVLGERLLLHHTVFSKSETILGTKLDWHEISQAARKNSNVEAKINELAFNLTSKKPQAGSKLASGDYVIAYLKKIHYGNTSKLDKKQFLKRAEQLAVNDGQMVYNFYLNKLFINAKINYA